MQLMECFIIDYLKKIILGNFTNEQILVRNFLKISPSKVNWSLSIETNFRDLKEKSQIDYIILTILDLLEAAIYVNNEGLIAVLIKGYCQYNLYDYDEKDDYVLF